MKKVNSGIVSPDKNTLDRKHATDYIYLDTSYNAVAAILRHDSDLSAKYIICFLLFI